MARTPKSRRRSLPQTLLQPVAWLIRKLFDARSLSWFSAALVLIGLLFAWPAAELLGVRPGQLLAAVGVAPPTPPRTAPRLVKLDYTCIEQDWMRQDWREFGEGVPSGAPHPWRLNPPVGLFHIGNPSARAAAYQAVDDLRAGGDPTSAGDQLRSALGHINGVDRGVIQFHSGLISLRRGAYGQAVRQFEGVEKALRARFHGLSGPEFDRDPRAVGVEVASLHARGVAKAQMPELTAKADGARDLQQALTIASRGSDANPLRAPADKDAVVYRLRPASMVDLHLAEIYADAIAANLRVLAVRGVCDKPAYEEALGRLRSDIKPFQENPGAAADWPALAANLQLAGAMLGESTFVQKFSASPGDGPAAQAGRDAQTAVGAVAVADAADTAEQDPGDGDRWRRIKRLKVLLASGDAAQLRSELAALPAGSDASRETRAWAGEVIRKARDDDDASAHDRRRIDAAYGDLIGAVRLDPPLGLMAGIGLALLIAAAYALLAVALVRVRTAYVRLFVSEHRRERKG